MAASSADSPALLAALYLEAVLPAIPLLAACDASMASMLEGSDFAVVFSTVGHLRARLEIQGNTCSATKGAEAIGRPGDLHLWFPSAAQVVRAFDGRHRFALALPVGGWHRLPQTRRIAAAGNRLEVLLNCRPAPAAPDLALHAWGRLAVALAASASWLRHHPKGPDTRARLGTGIATFDCPAFPAKLWINLDKLTTGSGPLPAQAEAVVGIVFADLDTVLAELDHRLDAPAAIGLGTLRLTGKVPLAESLGLILLKVGKLLQPPPAVLPLPL